MILRKTKSEVAIEGDKRGASTTLHIKYLQHFSEETITFEKFPNTLRAVVVFVVVVVNVENYLNTIMYLHCGLALHQYS